MARTRIGPPPPPQQKTSNLDARDEWVDMGFRVKRSLRTEFKLFATRHNMSMTDVLKLGFDLAKQKLEP